MVGVTNKVGKMVDCEGEILDRTTDVDNLLADV